MTATEDRLSELRQQLSESVARLAELEAAAIDAMVEAKAERDISALETRKAQARDRVVLLQKTIKQLEHQLQLDAQQRMLDQTMAVYGAADPTLRRRLRPSWRYRRTPGRCTHARSLKWSSRRKPVDGSAIQNNKAATAGMNAEVRQQSDV